MQGLFLLNRQRERKGEGAACAGIRRDPEISFMRIDNRLHDCKAESVAFLFAGFLLGKLRKFRFIREKVEGAWGQLDSGLHTAGMTNKNNQLRLSSSGLTRGSRRFSTLIRKTQNF